MSIKRCVMPILAFTSRLSSTAAFRGISSSRTCILAFDPIKTNPIIAHQHRYFHSSTNFATKLAGASVQLKKRAVRKKVQQSQTNTNGFYNVMAYATAEEYDLESLHTALTKQDLYQTKKFFTEGSSGSDGDVLHVRAKYQVENEPHEIFFFREGSVVLWNCSEEETGNLLRELKVFEINSNDEDDIMAESESMLYKYTDGQQAQLKSGNFFIQSGDAGDLDRYTFSNAMMSSVKLGIWEAALERYVNNVAFLTKDLKSGKKIKWTRSAVLQKIGELFALKHMLNLRSDLLDTPDFYWERENLERLFLQTSNYFSIQRRTKVGAYSELRNFSIFNYLFFFMCR